MASPLQPDQTGDGPLQKKPRVTLDMGAVSQASTTGIFKVLLASSVKADQLYGLQKLTKQMKSENPDQYGSLMDAEVISNLVRYLQGEKSETQILASCALANFCAASGENCTAVVNAGALIELVKLLDISKDLAVADNSIRCLLNITTNAGHQDLVLRMGIVPTLVKWADHCLQINRKRSGSQTATPNDIMACNILNLYYNLCKSGSANLYYKLRQSGNGNQTEFQTLEECLPVLTRIVKDFQDSSVLDAGCRIINLTCEKLTVTVVDYFEVDLCTRLSELFSHSDQNVAQNAFLAVVNVSIDHPAWFDEAMKFGVLPKLFQLMNAAQDDYSLKIACMFVGILLGGTGDNIQQVIDAQLIPGLVQAAKVGVPEVMLVATNRIVSATRNKEVRLTQVKYLVEQGVLEALCHQLTVPTCVDNDIVSAKVMAIADILCKLEEYELTDGKNPLGAGSRVVSTGAVTEIIKLLSITEDPELAAKCIHALLQITTIIENPDVVLREGIIPPMIKWAEYCLEINRKEGTETNEYTNMPPRIVGVYWTLSSTKNNDPVGLAALDFLPTLTRMLNGFMGESDYELLEMGCEAINNLAVGSMEVQLAAVSESGVCACLVKLLMHDNSNVVGRALHAIANVTHKSVTCQEQLVTSGILPGLVHCLEDVPDDDDLERIFRIIRNLGKTPANIQKIIDAQLIPGLIEAAKRADSKVGLQATEAICTFTKKGRGTTEQVDYLVEQGALEALCFRLTPSTDEIILTKKLNGLSYIMERAKDQPEKLSGWQERIGKCEGFRRIEMLQTHKNVDIYQKAFDLAHKCFDCQKRMLNTRATFINIDD